MVRSYNKVEMVGEESQWQVYQAVEPATGDEVNQIRRCEFVCVTRTFEKLTRDKVHASSLFFLFCIFDFFFQGLVRAVYLKSRALECHFFSKLNARLVFC